MQKSIAIGLLLPLFVTIKTQVQDAEKAKFFRVLSPYLEEENLEGWLEQYAEYLILITD